MEAYKRNDNFRGLETISVPEPTALEWPVGGFKTITATHKDLLPLILDGHISSYFQYRMAMDKQMNTDVKAMTKGKALMEAGRVKTASFRKEDSMMFVTSIVGAMMKKKVE